MLGDYSGRLVASAFDLGHNFLDGRAFQPAMAVARIVTGPRPINSKEACESVSTPSSRCKTARACRSRPSSVVRNTTAAPRSAHAKCSASKAPNPSFSSCSARVPSTRRGATFSAACASSAVQHGAADPRGPAFANQLKDTFNRLYFRTDTGLILVVGQTIQATHPCTLSHPGPPHAGIYRENSILCEGPA